MITFLPTHVPTDPQLQLFPLRRFRDLQHCGAPRGLARHALGEKSQKYAACNVLWLP